MSDKNDILIKVFRKRLKNYEQPVEKDVWSDIERDLQAIPQKRRPTIWIWAGVAATVLIALMTGILMQPEGNKQAPVLADQKPKKKISTQCNPEQKSESATFTKDMYAENMCTTSHRTPATTKDKQPDVLPAEVHDAVVSDASENQSSSIVTEQKEEQKTTGEKKIIQRLTDDSGTDSWISVPGKKKRNMSYALALGNSGQSLEADPSGPDMLQYNDMRAIDKVIGNSNYNELGEMLKPYNQSNPTTYDYGIPVSVSFSVRKYLTDHWALESGLTYTYLSSQENTTITNQGLQTRTISLNYIGIPVKGIYSLYHSDRWSVYLAAGGMAEKNVSGKSKITLKGQSSTGKLDVPEVQFSVFGNVGINYRLLDHLGLFIEPGISHYFDDKSDVMTIRKDSPTNFNIQGGIRLTY